MQKIILCFLSVHEFEKIYYCFLNQDLIINFLIHIFDLPKERFTAETMKSSDKSIHLKNLRKRE
jgi:hypothetical protein